MLIYFHKNKFRYEKGQLTPIFIVVLVILIIAAMVTVNLSKVAFIKTDSSNAVDAGALAAGSAMANVFNAVASANSQMEASYWEFYAAISVLFVIALAYLTYAITMACTDPCSALGAIGNFMKTTTAISVSVTAFSIAQQFFYLSIRDMAKKGRESAIKIGHKLTFINSGISSKLKQGSPLPGLVEPEKINNYRDIFKQFLDGLGDNEEYTYAWQDGQDRGHFVYSKITTDEVGTFELQVTVLPTPAITALLLSSWMLAASAEKALGGACACFNPCKTCCNKACAWAGCPCCPVYLAECAAAIGLMSGIFPLMAATWLGLLPGGTITSSSDSDALLFIICWIDDIVHNRLVRADTTQHHEGADLGLWQTRYPDTKSYSIVDFRGRGEIYPPKLRHDASIIETD